LRRREKKEKKKKGCCLQTGGSLAACVATLQREGEEDSNVVMNGDVWLRDNPARTT